MEFYAHKRLNDTGEVEYQSILEHCTNVANLAKEYGKYFPDKGTLSYYAGYYHDIGKYSKEFQNKIINSDNSKVDHSTAGGKVCFDKSWLVTMAIMSHHTGLFDISFEGSSEGLYARLNKEIPDFSIYKEYQKDLDLSLIQNPSFYNDFEKDYYSHFHYTNYIRFLTSSLVDADFLDTENYMNLEQSSLRNKKEFDTFEELSNKLESYLKQNYPNEDTVDLDKLDVTKRIDNNHEYLNCIRNSIRDSCLKVSQKDIESNLYELSVPTGLGKTLSSLVFAIEKAKKLKKDRIIYVIPYTNIITQTAKIFSDIFGKNNVLEHHCNVIFDNGNLILNHKKLLAFENWDFPIIVTTNVQFFESLYASRTSQLRKLHNIANSVLVFDEVQMLPVNQIFPCIKMIEDLNKFYNCISLFCTATQPCFEKIKGCKLEPYRIVNRDTTIKLRKILKRVTFDNIGRVSLDNLIELINKDKQCLCVVNTRAKAKLLYNQIDDLENCFYLTNSLTLKHKIEVLKEIKYRLDNQLPCRVISTSLIEVGVDLDFPRAYRELSGIDSLIQTSGRNNREWKASVEDSILTVFEFNEEVEATVNRYNPFVVNQIISKQVLADYDINDERIIDEYFRRLFQRRELDKSHILFYNCQKSKSLTEQFALRTISNEFNLISNNYVDVFVPLVLPTINLKNNEIHPEILLQKIQDIDSISKEMYRQLRKWTVQLAKSNFNDLKKSNQIEEINNIMVLKDTSLYDKNTGLF